MAASAWFDKFKVWYYSSHAQDAYYDALIYCYQGTTQVGRIEFYKNEVSPDILSSRVSNGQPVVRFRIERFHDVHQLLLHEKPLSLSVNETNGIGSIGTDALEPTGEEEP